MEKKLYLREAFRFAFNTIIDNFGFFAKLFLAYLLLSGLGLLVLVGVSLIIFMHPLIEVFQFPGVAYTRELFFKIFTSTATPFYFLLFFGALLLFALFDLILNIGVKNICLRLYDKKTVSVGMIFSRIEILPYAYAASVLYGFILLSGLIIGIVPGFFFGMLFGFFLFSMVDKNTGIFDSFKYSMVLTKGVRLKLFFWWMVTAILQGALKINFIGPVLFLFFNLIDAYIYKRLKEQTENPSTR